MARPCKCRCVCSVPEKTIFGSLKGKCKNAEHLASDEVVKLGIDEYEVIRLIDYVGLSQEDCAQKMQVARTTVARMYDIARKKIAEMMINGKKIVISGGDFVLCEKMKPECADETHCCHKNKKEVKIENENVRLTPEDIKRVKGWGFLQDKTRENCFNGRVITRNGKITSEESFAIAEAAEIFGSGEITFTTRMTVEIQGVPYENIEPLRDFLCKAGLETGGTGPKVRPIVSCKGTTCQFGLIDTFKLSEEIHERFYKGFREMVLPHKFKIAVGGCPNNCVKPDLNDMGIIGQRVPMIDSEKCKGCKVCAVEKACPMKAAYLENGKVKINEEICNNCGRCLTKCPFKAIEENTVGYKIYIGGRWGKKVARGKALEKIFVNEKDVLDTIEKAILFFKEQGIQGERFSDTIDRIGFDKVQEILL